MRVLFFSVTNAGFSANNVEHNGGGWIFSLAKALISADVELGIAFEGSGEWGCEKNGITYYPVQIFNSFANKLKRKFNFRTEEHLMLPLMQQAVNDFKPDVIHIWGSESVFGKIVPHTSVPCVIHLQGFLPAYSNAKFPPGVNRFDYFCYLLWHPVRLYRFFWYDFVFRKRAEREAEIVAVCQNFFGRTQWDNDIVKLYNPKAEYFHCGELLRSEFYQIAGKWKYRDNGVVTIVSVLSTPTYKGHDLILKTAEMLKKHTSLKFKWKVFGGADFSFWKKKLKLSAADLGVISAGTVSAQQLCEELLNASVFVHPSYIDNSPNSVGEAQLVGVPVVAAATGGVPSLVENGKTGFLVPANDPISMAKRIVDIAGDKTLCENISDAAVEIALKRHALETVVNDCMTGYGELMKKC